MMGASPTGTCRFRVSLNKSLTHLLRAEVGIPVVVNGACESFTGVFGAATDEGFAHAHVYDPNKHSSLFSGCQSYMSAFETEVMDASEDPASWRTSPLQSKL